MASVKLLIGHEFETSASRKMKFPFDVPFQSSKQSSYPKEMKDLARHSRNQAIITAVGTNGSIGSGSPPRGSTSPTRGSISPTRLGEENRAYLKDVSFICYQLCSRLDEIV